MSERKNMTVTREEDDLLEPLRKPVRRDEVTRSGISRHSNNKPDRPMKRQRLFFFILTFIAIATTGFIAADRTMTTIPIDIETYQRLNAPVDRVTESDFNVHYASSAPTSWPVESAQLCAIYVFCYGDDSPPIGPPNEGRAKFALVNEHSNPPTILAVNYTDEVCWHDHRICSNCVPCWRPN